VLIPIPYKHQHRPSALTVLSLLKVIKHFKWQDVKKSQPQNDWNWTMFLCSNFSVWSVVLWFFSYTNTLAFVSPCIHCILIIWDYNVRSVKNQQVIHTHRSVQCFIDRQENNNGN